MFTDTNIGRDALEELSELSKDRHVLYVFPGLGENVKTLSIGARSVWAVGTRLSPANPFDPTPAAELVHNLESSFLGENTTLLLGETEVIMGSILSLHFDLVVIDWCDARLFTPGLLWRAAALASRIAVAGAHVGPRAQLTEALFKGTGYLHYGFYGTKIFTAPGIETVPEAEVY